MEKKKTATITEHLKPSVVDESEWIMTDDDSMQHVKRLSETKFKLVEFALTSRDPDSYEVYTDTLDMNDYLTGMKDELEAILKGFGYDSIESVREAYGEEALQVMAECVFEHYGSFQAHKIYVGTETMCRLFVTCYVGKSIAGSRRLKDEDIVFEDEIEFMDAPIYGLPVLNFYLATWFNVDDVFGTEANTSENGDFVNVYANYDCASKCVCDWLDVFVSHECGDITELRYELDENEISIIEKKMERYANARHNQTLADIIAEFDM